MKEGLQQNLVNKLVTQVEFDMFFKVQEHLKKKIKFEHIKVTAQMMKNNELGMA